MSRTFDRIDTKANVAAFKRSLAAENQYGIRLRKIARGIGDIVSSFPAGDPSILSELQEALRRYSIAIKPYAQASASLMIAEANRRDRAAWGRIAKQMGVALREEMEGAGTGARMRELLDLQVGLIQSMPLDQAKRVHHLTMEGMASSARYNEVVKEIMRTKTVSLNDATRIARTESGRVSTVLTQARAESVESEGYIWRTADDSRVRPSHAAMEGKFVRWDSPPTLDNLTGHAGALINCRCFPEVVLPRLDVRKAA